MQKRLLTPKGVIKFAQRKVCGDPRVNSFLLAGNHLRVSLRKQEVKVKGDVNTQVIQDGILVSGKQVTFIDIFCVKYKVVITIY